MTLLQTGASKFIRYWKTIVIFYFLQNAFELFFNDLSSHKGEDLALQRWYKQWVQAGNTVFPDVRWERRCYSNNYWSLPPAVAMAINQSLHCYLFPLSGWFVDRHPSPNQSQLTLLQHPSQLYKELHFSCLLVSPLSSAVCLSLTPASLLNFGFLHFLFSLLFPETMIQKHSTKSECPKTSKQLYHNHIQIILSWFSEQTKMSQA